MSSSDIKNPKLKDLDEKLKDIRKNKVGSNTDNQAFKSAHIGWRMVLELVIGIIIGVVLGFTLDSFLTHPQFF
jgi:F0F1-type ATP synthase assembly protein I